MNSNDHNEVTQEELEKDAKEYILHVMSNEGNDAPAMSLLMMFVDGVFKNKIGMMRALDVSTGKTRLIIVGLETNEDGSMSSYPLAAVLDAEDATYFHSPDGTGGYSPGTYTKGEVVAEEEAVAA